MRWRSSTGSGLVQLGAWQPVPPAPPHGRGPPTGSPKAPARRPPFPPPARPAPMPRKTRCRSSARHCLLIPWLIIICIVSGAGAASCCTSNIVIVSTAYHTLVTITVANTLHLSSVQGCDSLIREHWHRYYYEYRSMMYYTMSAQWTIQIAHIIDSDDILWTCLYPCSTKLLVVGSYIRC